MADTEEEADAKEKVDAAEEEDKLAGTKDEADKLVDTE